MGQIQKIEAFNMLKSEQFQSQLKMALPKIMPLEKFTRSIITQINKNPKLLDCTQESLFSSVISLAAAGLEADGYNAHILPYGKTATPILDYKGIIELMYRSGQISAVNGYAVYSNDDFEFNLGEVTRHKVDYNNDRGQIIGAFTIVKMKDGTKSFHFMSKQEIDVIGKTSPGFNSQYSPWKKYYDAMAIKTVLRQHSKWVPIASEAKDIILKEVEAEVQVNAKPQAAPLRLADLTDLADDQEPKNAAQEQKKELNDIDAPGFAE